jgi:hypothetical protein
MQGLPEVYELGFQSQLTEQRMANNQWRRVDGTIDDAHSKVDHVRVQGRLAG